jgi:hypothetical protein
MHVAFYRRKYPSDGGPQSGLPYGEPILGMAVASTLRDGSGRVSIVVELEDGSVEATEDVVQLDPRKQVELWRTRVSPKARRLPGGTPVTPAGQRDFMCIMLDALLDKTIDDEIKDRAKKLIDKLRDNEI